MQAFLEIRDIQTLSHLRPSDWIAVDRKGDLYKVEGYFSKFLFRVMNFVTCGHWLRRTSERIHYVCHTLLQNMITHEIPLDSQHQDYQIHQPALKALRNGLKILHPRFVRGEDVQMIRELASCPEITEGWLAIDADHPPTFLQEGVSGSYKIHNRMGKTIGIFKPAEQEAGTHDNPKLYGDMYRTEFQAGGIEPGTAYLRERLAYKLDHNHFSGVPYTRIATFSIEGRLWTGSFQIWVQEAQQAIDYTPLFRFIKRDTATRISVDSVHKIALLDLRLLNRDRHAGNILVNPSYQMIPIDHGFTLPSSAAALRFEAWMEFPQSKKPFSPQFRDYILSLNPNEDMVTITQKAPEIPRAALRRFHAATRLLQIGAEQGLSPLAIGERMLGYQHQGLGSEIFDQKVQILKNKVRAFVRGKKTSTTHYSPPSPPPSRFEIILGSQMDETRDLIPDDMLRDFLNFVPKKL